MEKTAAPLQPNRDVIDRHLSALFSPTFVHAHPGARIEIAYSDPRSDKGPNRAKTFSAFDLSQAADFAEGINKCGHNVYVGAALRDAQSTGRTAKEAVVTGSRAWADFDDPGDETRVSGLLRANGIYPSEIVQTGSTPHRRFQIYVKLAGTVTPRQLEDANTALKTWLGGDDVQGMQSLMRLAGTVAFPTKDKLARGYISEIVRLRFADVPAYTVEHLTTLAGTAAGNTSHTFGFSTKCGRSDDELEARLEASRAPLKWHNNIRAAIATMIGRGWCDDAIRFTLKPYCKDGYGDHDLDDLIDRGRAKWNKPDAEAEHDYDDEFGQQAKPPGIPLDYYENFGTAVAKKPIIKGVINKGERSSWIGPPGSGKSALLANIATHVAEGHDWRDYRSKGRIGVVYFALERGQLAKRRLMAHALQTRKLNLPIAVASGIINLLNSGCVATIIDTIRTAEAHFGFPVGLIVIDTFNKGIAAGSGDEDKAKDQNTAAANLQQVQDALTDVHIALIGHTGKDESRGARGSNAHLGDVDMMVQISAADGVRTATITKNNDGAEGLLTRFKLEVVVLDQDEDGDDITTAIVSQDLLDAKKENSRAKLTKSQRRAMEMLERVIIDLGKPGPISSQYPTNIKVVTVEQWRDACFKGGLSPAGTEASADKAFRRAMKDLLALHRVGTWDGLVWIAYE